jgi:adenylylsulfate kinase
MSRSAVVWLTGLSGAGKTTLAAALRGRLAASGREALVFDGDELRRTISADLGFSKTDRDEHVRRVAALAATAADNGRVAIVALIAPYRDARDAARRDIEARHCFVEVYVDCPMAILRERDPKGLYRKADAGELSRFTGVSDPYEAPLRPNLRLDTSILDVARSVDALVAAMDRACGGPGSPSVR